MMMFRKTVFVAALLLMAAASLADVITIQSPDGTVEMKLTVGDTLSYSVTMDGKTVVADSPLQVEFADGSKFGPLSVVSQKTTNIDSTWTAVVGRKSEIRDRCTQSVIQLREQSAPQRRFALEYRVYNDAAAFRYVFAEKALSIKEEHSQFAFQGDYTCWPAFLNSYTTEHQALYPESRLSDISPEDIIGLPLTIKLDNGLYCSVTEAALDDWAGVYLTRSGRSDLLVESGDIVGGAKPFEFRRRLPEGTQKIKFVLDPAGDNSFDHVDIVEAKLTLKSGKTLWLSDLSPSVQRQDWGRLRKNRSVDNNPLTIAGKVYEKGLGTHAAGVLAWKLPDDCIAVEARVGIDSEVEDKGKVRFKLYGVRLQEETEDIVLTSTLSPRQDDSGVAVKIDTVSHSPWRVVMLGRTPADLLSSDVIVNLNEPSRIADPSWIKAGVASWNWLSCGGDMDMDLLKGFIDLSASMNWEYALIDDGWYANWDCTRSIESLDIPALVAYAAERNVKLWLWVHWNALDQRMEATFDQFEKWGIVGAKIDFMSRDDQWMVNWYHKVLKLAAEHKLMINFHGSYKPTGVRRTWPNLMTREAIYGEEQNLGSRQNDPVHKTTLPFTRMLAGPMDYTPGSMLNATAESWSAGRPVKTLGTRCQELAICVIYDSPIQSMADKPENYYHQEGLEFLKDLPASWDDTQILNGEIGEYITSARRSGDTWYLASITNWQERTMDVPLDFLKSGRWQVVLYEDGPEADTNAKDIKRRELTVKAGDTLKVKMASGGGFVATIRPAP